MKVPIFEEIKWKNYEEAQIIALMQKLKLEKRPFYIDLTEIGDRYKLQSILEYFHQSFLYLNYHPSFPYPFYFLTELLSQYKNLNIAKDISELPDHFFRSLQRLNSKEIKKIKKIDILSGKIQNQNFLDKIETIKNLSINQKTLYKITHELSFYEQIISAIEKYRHEMVQKFDDENK